MTPGTPAQTAPTVQCSICSASATRKRPRATRSTEPLPTSRRIARKPTQRRPCRTGKEGPRVELPQTAGAGFRPDPTAPRPENASTKSHAGPKCSGRNLSHTSTGLSCVLRRGPTSKTRCRLAPTRNHPPPGVPRISFDYPVPPGPPMGRVPLRAYRRPPIRKSEGLQVADHVRRLLVAGLRVRCESPLDDSPQVLWCVRLDFTEGDHAVSGCGSRQGTLDNLTPPELVVSVRGHA